MGAGKSTIARAIAERLGIPRISFGDYVRYVHLSIAELLGARLAVAAAAMTRSEPQRPRIVRMPTSAFLVIMAGIARKR
jgi:cytidylate kinase